MMVKLEEQFDTWPKMAEEIANRIETKLNPSNWNRKKFINWFMLREKVGICFDYTLIHRAYVISKQLNDETDHFTVIIGKEGTGKTTLGVQFCAWVSPNMDIADVCFNSNDYISKLIVIKNDYKQNKIDENDKSIQIDEGAIDLFSREAMSNSNRVLNKTFMIQRFLNVHVVICIPSFWALDTLVREHRIKTLIIVKKRGDYKCIVGKGISIMNKLGKKDKTKDLIAIPIPYGYFWEGHFRKDFPKTISKEDYNQHKFKHIGNFLKEVREETKEPELVKASRLYKELGLNSITVANMIKKKELRGKKIGSQWFIPISEYKRIISLEKA